MASFSGVMGLSLGRVDSLVVAAIVYENYEMKKGEKDSLEVQNALFVSTHA